MEKLDIIHVEDNHLITEALKKLFESRRISYHAVGSIEELDEALRKAEARVYVIDDHFLDRVGGSIGQRYLGAIEAVQQRNPAAPIILFTSKDLSEIAKTIGIGYINKKEKIHGLVHMVHEMLGYFPQKRSKT